MGTTMKKILSITFMIALTGCSTWGGGTYSDTTTDNKRQIEATGAAAAEAAKSNRSIQTLGTSGGYLPSNRSSSSGYSRPSPLDRISRSAENAVVSGASSAINRAIFSLF